MAADPMRRVLMPPALLVWLLAAGALGQQRGDLLIADFEGPDYGAWHSWDVTDLLGKPATIQIVDNRRGGWGHINVDQIVQSDRYLGVIETTRDLRIEHDYVSFRFGGAEESRSQIQLIIDDQTVRQARGTRSDKPSWISWDVSRLKGKSGRLKVTELPGPDGAAELARSVVHGDQPRGAVIVVDRLYQETYRPQFHFTPKRNWTNDPNGLVYYQGEYHLFFQHNPFGINWGNMTWGHAVSQDLVHWEQLDNAIEPDELGTIFSGSAVVDENNTAGFQTGDEKVIVAIFTYAGSHARPPKPFTQGIAYSNDRGRTFSKYEKNPVVGHFVGSNRDPKVIWHRPSGKWVMALYLDRGKFRLLGSKNLKQWETLSDVDFPGGHECPEFFELPVDADQNNTRWVFWEAGGRHRIGRFDGTTFKPETGVLPSKWGNNCYAGQTYNNVPESDGRRIFIAWMSGGKYPEMPFNQQMTFPRRLTLRTTDEGIRLFAYPVREIEKLYTKKHNWSDLALKPGDNPLASLEGELWDVDAVIEPQKAEAIELNVRGEKIRYDVAEKRVSCLGKSATLEPVDGRIELRVLVDRTSLEIFANRGRVVMSFCFLPNPADRGLGLRAEGQAARVVSLALRELRSAWPQ